jgi:hypothetical protein
VGGPTLQAVYGNRVIPGLLDHYLATKAWQGEQTAQPADRDRPDNLFESVPGDWGAHGRFDSRSKAHSVELTARLNRTWLAVAGAGLAGLAVGALVRRREGDGEP